MPEIKSLFPQSRLPRTNQTLLPNISTPDGIGHANRSGDLFIIGEPKLPVAEDRDRKVGGKILGTSIGSIGDSSGGITNTPTFNLGRRSTQASVPTIGQEDVDKSVQFARDRARENFKTTSDVVNQGLGDAFDDVFESLDAQLEGLSGQRDDQARLIEESIGSGRRTIEGQREKSLADLDESEETVRGTTRKNLRSLAEDVRNQLQAAGQFIGGLGAGDSSAAGLAAGAVGKAGLKRRGEALELQQVQLRQIDRQRADVERVANEAFNQLDQQKREQLGELARFYSNRISQLEEQKRNTTLQRAQAITGEQVRLRENLQARLQDLDDEVRGRQSQIVEWNRARAAQLEDTAASLARSGQFRGQKAFEEQQAQITELATNYMAANPGMSRAEAIRKATEDVQTGIFIDPLFIKEKRKEFAPQPRDFVEERDQLLAKQELEELSPSLQPSQGFIPDSIPVLGRF